MKKDKEVTDVIFRKFKDGEIIGLFPYIPEFRYKTCVSYMHVGQHGIAHLEIIRTTKPASETEYLDLFSELENQIGYKLRIIKRLSWKKYKRTHDLLRLRIEKHVKKF